MQVIETSKQLVNKLLELELMAREDGKVYVPWKDVVLNVSLTGDSLVA